MSLPRQRRPGVSAPTVNTDNLSSWKPPVHTKTSQERIAITEAIKKLKVLFGHLSRKNLSHVIDAFFSESYTAGSRIIEQGDEGSNFYVIQSGLVGFYVTRETNSEPKEVGRAGPMGSFGELALLYGSPRAATVMAITDTDLWALDRETFQLMVTTTENTKKRSYEEFIENIAIFKGLNRYEIVSLCDMLIPETFRPGQCIVRQREFGDRFYLVEKGRATAVIEENGVELVVQHYAPGRYFGELALIGDGQRSASVYAVSKCRLLSIDKCTFDRVLGPLLELFKNNVDAYREALENCKRLVNSINS